MIAAPYPGLAPDLLGKLVTDRGYISKKLGQQWRTLFDLLLITKLRSNMKNQRLPMADKRRARSTLQAQRAFIETTIDQLKNIAQIEVQHRSRVNFMVHVLCGLMAYGHQIQEISSKNRSKTPK